MNTHQPNLVRKSCFLYLMNITLDYRLNVSTYVLMYMSYLCVTEGQALEVMHNA